MKISEFKETVRTALRERSINAISKLQQKNVENIAKALEFYKKNKHTDKKEPFIKLLKKLGKEKEALSKELDLKVSGMYKNAEYKGESVEESVNEGYSKFIKAKNLTDIVALSKKKKNAVFYVTDDNNSRIGTFYLKNGKFAKATSANPNYDLQNSKTKLKDRSDVIYKYKIDESVVNEMAMGFDSMTGLFYVKGVPFTRERVKEVLQFFMKSKAKSAVNQFEYTPSLIVKDKVGRHEVTIDPKNLKTLVDFYKKNSAKLASDKDF